MAAASKKILIVDDEPYVIHVVRFKLEQAGYEILVANNANTAYDMACADAPDLVITDFQMPGSSGLDLAMKLRKNPSTADTPIVMLTARGHLARLSELAETNVRTLLAKPFSPRNLLTKVNELLADPSASGSGEGDGASGVAAA